MVVDIVAAQAPAKEKSFLMFKSLERPAEVLRGFFFFLPKISETFVLPVYVVVRVWKRTMSIPNEHWRNDGLPMF